MVLATTEVDKRGRGNFLGTGPGLLKEIGGRFGNGLLPTDPGELYRRVDFSVGRMETFSVAAVETATGRQVDPEMFGGEPAWIDFRGPPNTIRAVSFSDVVQGHVKRGFFRDKLVVVGPYAPSLQDVHPTSTTGTDEQMSGAEIQANAIDTIRRGLPLESGPAPLDVALIVLMGLAAPVGSLVMPSVRALGLTLALGVAFLVAAQLAFNGGTVLSFVYPVTALLLCHRGGAGRLLGHHGLRARARARHVLALRSRERGGRRAGARRRGTSAGRRRARGNGDVHRPARLHELRRVDGPRAGDRRPQPVPHRDERRDHGPRRNARRLHGRRDHGRVRSADRAGRPRRSRPRHGARDARGPARSASTSGSDRGGSETASGWASA